MKIITLFIAPLFFLASCPQHPCEDRASSASDYTIGMEDEFTITPLKKTYKVGEQVHVTLIIKVDKARKVDKKSLNIKKRDFSKAKPTDEVVDIYPIIGDFVFQETHPYYMSSDEFTSFLFSPFAKIKKDLGYHQDKKQYVYDAVITFKYANTTGKYSFKQGEIFFGKTLREVDCHNENHTHIINLPKAIEFEVVE